MKSIPSNRSPHLPRHRQLWLAAGLCFALGSAGCSSLFMNRTQRTNSSLVSYLYPKSEPKDAIKPTIPTLSLPLKVGVAWVPEPARPGGRAADSVLTEERRQKLAESVIPHFQQHPFIKSIEIIPSAYLTAGGGFANLDQLKSMLGVDVVALLSYDQLQTSDTTQFSILYWTIVGAYIIPGEANMTHTMIDAAVFDVASRQLLFRAPGTSRVKGHSTPLRVTEVMRGDRETGFNQASTNMVSNLQSELAHFQARIKQSPESVRILREPGYKGAGAIDARQLVLLGMAVASLVAFSRRRS